MWPKPSRKAIPKKIREQVKARYDGHCGYCGEKPEKLQIDHIRAVDHGGTDNIENLMAACFACNNYKNVLSLEVFRRELQEQVTRARKNSVNFRLAEKFGQVIVKEFPIKFYFEKVRDEIPRKLDADPDTQISDSNVLDNGRTDD